MSQPKNTPDQNTRRNTARFVGFIAILAVATFVLVWWLDWEIGEATSPEQTDSQIEQRLGTQAEGTEDTDPVDVPQTSTQSNPQDLSPDPAPAPETTPVE